MKYPIRQTLKTASAVAYITLMNSAAWAQVNASAGSASVNNKLNIFLQIVTGLAAILFTYCFTVAGYRFATIEGTKLTDLRGLLIGGVLAGGAATFAYLAIS